MKWVVASTGNERPCVFSESAPHSDCTAGSLQSHHTTEAESSAPIWEPTLALMCGHKPGRCNKRKLKCHRQSKALQGEGLQFEFCTDSLFHGKFILAPSQQDDTARSSQSRSRGGETKRQNNSKVERRPN